MSSILDDCTLIELPGVVDSRGSLSFVEGGRHCPFPIARLFYMHGFAVGTRRGSHAHRECQQFLISLAGRFEVTLHDGARERSITLCRPNQALHIPAGIWVSLVSQDEGAVITALASAPYEEADYLRDFGAFLEWKRGLTEPEPLTDGRILVRPYRLDDAAALSGSARESAAEVGRWLAWCTPEFNVERAEEYIRRVNQSGGRPSEYSFGIFDQSDAASHLGGVSLNRIEWDARCGNLGYWVATRASRRGIGTAATELMCGFGFEKLGLKRIDILVEVGNTTSRRLAERLGARFEGNLRARIHRGASWFDAELYGLLDSDFPGRRPGPK